jgi:hypothetical protein
MPVQWSCHTMTEDQSKCLEFPLEVQSHFLFEVMKACCLLHLEFISYFVLVLRALSALTVEQAFYGLLPELALFSLWQDDLKTSEEESLQIIPIFFQRMCFSFSDLCFGKNFELMGSDKIRTALHSYRYIVCHSVSPLSLPLTKSSNLEKNAHIWSWFFPLWSSHSWIISYDLKWYKTSVVFTTVFHRAFLSCRWQQNWIVAIKCLDTSSMTVIKVLTLRHTELFNQ